MFHPAEDLQKYLLGGIGRVGRVIDDAVDEAVDGLMKLANEPRIGLLGPGLQFCNDGRFFESGSDSACEIAHLKLPPPRRRRPHYKITAPERAGIFVARD